MGELVGFVTRSRGAANLDMFGVTGQSPAGQHNQFVACKINGVRIDSYATLAQARQAVEKSTGSGLLKWTRVDLPNRIEHWEGRSTDFYPGDLGPLLEGGGWWKGGVALVGPNAVQSKVSRWVSQDGSAAPNLVQATQATLADRPSLVTEDVGALPAMGFSTNVTEFMGTNLTIVSPMTIVAVVKPELCAHGLSQVVVQSAGFSYYLDAAAGYRWTFSLAAAAVSGPVATMGDAAIISVISNTVAAGGAEAFINGVSFGTLNLQAASNQVSISDAVTSWGGTISELIMVPAALGLPKHDALVTYCRKKYLFNQ